MTSRRTHRCSAGASGQWRVAVQCQRLPYVVESRGAVLVVPMTRSVGGPGGRRVGGQVSEVRGVRSGQLDSKVSGLTSKREKR